MTNDEWCFINKEPSDDDTNKAIEKQLASGQPRWSREDVQRVLFHVVQRYKQAITTSNGRGDKTPRRFILFGQRLPFLGGDSELLRSAIFDVAIPTLKDNNWWPPYSPNTASENSNYTDSEGQ